jgi:hypothetical protein
MHRAAAHGIAAQVSAGALHECCDCMRHFAVGRVQLCGRSHDRIYRRNHRRDHCSKRRNSGSDDGDADDT